MTEQIRVLIVEDEEDIGDIVAFNLVRDGYQVLVADKVEDAR